MAGGNGIAEAAITAAPVFDKEISMASRTVQYIIHGDNFENHVKEMAKDGKTSFGGTSRWETVFQKYPYGKGFKEIETFMEKTLTCLWVLLNVYAHFIRIKH